VEAAPSLFKEQAPYVLSLAKLAEGPKVLAWMDKGILEGNIQVGMKMKLNPIKLSNGNLSYSLAESG
jgi:uncharacterized OB-fold protein